MRDGSLQMAAWVVFVLLILSGHHETVNAADFHVTVLKPGGRIVNTVIGDFDNDGRGEIFVAVRRESETGATERHLIVYARESADAGLTMLHDFRVANDVSAFAIGDYLGKGRSQVVFLTRRSAFALESPQSDPVRLLDSLNFIFNLPNRGELAYWDYTPDIDGDGLTDLLLADGRGYRVYRQSVDHRLILSGIIEGDYSFSMPRARSWGRNGLQVSASADGQGSGGEVRTSRGSSSIRTSRRLGRICLGDVNADGRLDLITVRDRQLRAHLQRDPLSFGSKPDLVYPLGPKDGSSAWEESSTNIVHGDINRDGRLDFVVTEIDTKELGTKLRVYLWKDSGIAEAPDQIIKLRGLGSRVDLLDINGDGFPDLAFTALRADKMLKLRRPSLEEIDVGVTVHLFDPDLEQFGRRPALNWETTISITESMTQEQQLVYWSGDFTGDGILDLLIHENRGELLVYAGQTKGRDAMKMRLGSKPALRHETSLPLDFLIEDLDGDGKSDVVLRHSETLEVLTPR